MQVHARGRREMAGVVRRPAPLPEMSVGAAAARISQATDGRVVSIKLIYNGYNAAASWSLAVNRERRAGRPDAQTNGAALTAHPTPGAQETRPPRRRVFSEIPSQAVYAEGRLDLI